MGFKLLNIESNIVIRVLIELAKKGLVALPFHDCVMVAESTQRYSAEGDGRGVRECDWCKAGRSRKPSAISRESSEQLERTCRVYRSVVDPAFPVNMTNVRRKTHQLVLLGAVA